MKILKTRNYSAFKFYELNRNVSSRAVAKLASSIRQCNLLPYRPIIVDTNMYVVDGQHRLEAAKLLNEEVYFMVLEQDINGQEAMILLNQKQAEWRQMDFLNYHAGSRGGEYKELIDFIEKNKIPLAYVREFFANKILDSQLIRTGRSSFEQSIYAQQIADFLNSEECKMSGLRSSYFIRALTKAFELYKPRQLEKLKKRLVYLDRKGTVEQYLTAFERLIKKK